MPRPKARSSSPSLRDDQRRRAAPRHVVTPGEGVELVARGPAEVVRVDRARRLRRKRAGAGGSSARIASSSASGVGQHRVQHRSRRAPAPAGWAAAAVAQAQRCARGEVAARARAADRDGVGPPTELGGVLARPVEGGDDLAARRPGTAHATRSPPKDGGAAAPGDGIPSIGSGDRQRRRARPEARGCSPARPPSCHAPRAGGRSRRPRASRGRRT